MNITSIRDIITQEFGLKANMKDVATDQNFFEAGVSSLTIIELQIKIEEKLGLSVKTSDLMRLTTIDSWIDAYVAVSGSQAQEVKG